MKIQVIFVFAFLILAAFSGQAEAAPAPRWKGWKKIEGAGRRVFKVAKDVLPVAQGYLEVYNGFKNG